MRPICAITGSNGYVGGCFKNYFLERGWEILELNRQPGSKGVKFILGQEVLPSSLQGVQALVHCAYDFRPLKWDDICAVNVEGTRKILSSARAAGVKKNIVVSTISAYPGCRSLYGKAKLEIEKIALDYDALAIRPGLVYGGQSGGMFGKLKTQVKSRFVPLIGDGRQIQYLVHQEDLSAFIESYASGDINPNQIVWTAANPAPWQFKDLLLQIARSIGQRPSLIPVPWRLVWRH